jgi:hypothetical protein
LRRIACGLRNRRSQVRILTGALTKDAQSRFTSGIAVYLSRRLTSRLAPSNPAKPGRRCSEVAAQRSGTKRHGRGCSAPWRPWHPSARLGGRPVPSGVSVRTARQHALPCGNPTWPLTNGLQLPLREQAEIPPPKLRDYALNPEHEEGRHKARVFAAALGIRREHWTYLRDQILRALESAPVTGVRLAGPWGCCTRCAWTSMASTDRRTQSSRVVQPRRNRSSYPHYDVRRHPVTLCTRLTIPRVE